MKMLLNKSGIHLLVLITSLLWMHQTLADVAVIANKSTTIGSIDKDTVKSIYLGKLKSWPDGSSLDVVDQSPGSKARRLFLKKVVRKKELKFDSYWSRKAFSGKGTPPRNMDNDADVKAWVAKTKGSIGFIDASTVDDSVKVLMLVK